MLKTKGQEVRRSAVKALLKAKGKCQSGLQRERKVGRVVAGKENDDSVLYAV